MPFKVNLPKNRRINSKISPLPMISYPIRAWKELTIRLESRLSSLITDPQGRVQATSITREINMASITTIKHRPKVHISTVTQNKDSATMVNRVTKNGKNLKKTMTSITTSTKMLANNGRTKIVEEINTKLAHNSRVRTNSKLINNNGHMGRPMRLHHSRAVFRF